MPSGEPRLLVDGLCFPEGPRWHDGRLYFSDMHGRAVMAIAPDGSCAEVVRVDNRPSGLGWLPSGELLIVSMLDRKLLSFDGSELRVHAELAAFAGGPCNDMVVDGSGRAYVGNFGFDWERGESPRVAVLCRVDPDGSTHVAAEDLRFPNGMVITPDGETLIVAETFARRLTAFTIDDAGALSERRVFAELEVAPDGICLDAEGCIWVSNPRPPGGFVRVAEGGEVRARIDLTDRAGFACMLGGAERRTLYLLEAFSSEPAKSVPGNGRIRCVDVAVPGAGSP